MRPDWASRARLTFDDPPWPISVPMRGFAIEFVGRICRSGM